MLAPYLAPEDVVSTLMESADHDPAVPVVVVDTSVLRTVGRNLDKNSWLVLTHWASWNRFRLIIPEVVLAEFVAHHRDSAVKNLQKRREAHERLQSIDDELSELPEFDLDEGIARYEHRVRAKLSDLVTISPVPNVSHSAIIGRMCRRQKPFGPDGKTGYRDALIWHTVLDLAAETDGADFFLLSNDSDFSSADDRTKLEASLQHELPPETRLQLVKTIEDLLGRYGEGDSAITELVIRCAMDNEGALRSELEKSMTNAIAEENETFDSEFRLHGTNFMISDVTEGPERDTAFVSIAASGSISQRGGREDWPYSFSATAIYDLRDDLLHHIQAESHDVLPLPAAKRMTVQDLAAIQREIAEHPTIQQLAVMQREIAEHPTIQQLAVMQGQLNDHLARDRSVKDEHEEE